MFSTCYKRMKILLTGATGYIGKRLLPLLVEEGYQVVCCVRDLNRLDLPDSIKEVVEVIEVDFFKEDTLNRIPKNIDAAYYLIHSMSSPGSFKEKEKICALNFNKVISQTRVQQVVYLGGIVNARSLSEHLSSRKMVEEALKCNNYHLTDRKSVV